MLNASPIRSIFLTKRFKSGRHSSFSYTRGAPSHPRIKYVPKTPTPYRPPKTTLPVSVRGDVAGSVTSRCKPKNTGTENTESINRPPLDLDVQAVQSKENSTGRQCHKRHRKEGLNNQPD